MGLQGMIGEMVMRCDKDVGPGRAAEDRRHPGLAAGAWRALAQIITALGTADATTGQKALIEAAAKARCRRSASPAPAAPASPPDRRAGSAASAWTRTTRRAWPSSPSTLRRKRTGGALLGDRIRMNAIARGTPSRIFMRSLATRDTGSEVSAALPG